MAKSGKFTDQLRRAVKGCGLTRYRIAKEIGVSESLLSRFMSSESGLSFAVLDRLAELIGIGVVLTKKQGQGTGGKGAKA
jgi:transcriptional regulator with XRE-family HTH domain